MVFVYHIYLPPALIHNQLCQDHLYTNVGGLDSTSLTLYDSLLYTSPTLALFLLALSYTFPPTLYHGLFIAPLTALSPSHPPYHTPPPHLHFLYHSLFPTYLPPYISHRIFPTVYFPPYISHLSLSHGFAHTYTHTHSLSLLHPLSDTTHFTTVSNPISSHFLFSILYISLSFPLLPFISYPLSAIRDLGMS